MKKYLINEVSRVTGLSRATILYYEEKGLIEPAQEEYSGYRKYSMKDITTIMFYQSLKNVGISVSEYVDVLNQTGETGYSDVYALVLAKKGIYLKRMMAYLSMWDETLAITYSLRSRERVIRMMESRGAWAVRFGTKRKKTEDRVFKEWNDYFLEKNISCFFRKEKVLTGDDSFDSGITCYEDCAMPLSNDMRFMVEYIPSKMCVMTTVPFDLNKDSFMSVIESALAYAEERDCRLDGDPWGHFGLRDELDGVSTDYLTMWVPVSPGKQ